MAATAGKFATKIGMSLFSGIMKNVTVPSSASTHTSTPARTLSKSPAIRLGIITIIVLFFIAVSIWRWGFYTPEQFDTSNRVFGVVPREQFDTSNRVFGVVPREQMCGVKFSHGPSCAHVHAYEYAHPRVDVYSIYDPVVDDIETQQCINSGSSFMRSGRSPKDLPE